MKRLECGNPVPEFTVTTHDGRSISLSDYRGKQAVVVFFYPKDGSPICTREACAFRDAYEEFVRAGVAVLGVSGDSDESHRRFAEENHLPFDLVSDADGALRRRFGVPKLLGVLPGRVTYVIDRDGVLRHQFASATSARAHVTEALRALGLEPAHS